MSCLLKPRNPTRARHSHVKLLQMSEGLYSQGRGILRDHSHELLKYNPSESCSSALCRKSWAFGHSAALSLWLVTYSILDRMSKSGQRISDPEYVGGIMDPTWSWKAWGSPRKSWRRWMGKRTSGLPWLACCHYSVVLAECQKMDGL